MVPKSNKKLFSSPLEVFLLFHGAFDTPKPKVQLIFLEKVNNLLTFLTLKITPKIKELKNQSIKEIEQAIMAK